MGRYLPSIIWGIIILFVSSLPNLQVPESGFDFGDKIFHFGEYLIFSLFLIPVARGDSRRPFSRKGITIWQKIALIGISLAVIDELHQIFIPGRFCELGDILADFLGIIVGLLIIRLRGEKCLLKKVL